MDDETPSPWSDEVIKSRIAAALEQHFPALAACVEPAEVDELKEACQVSFEFMLYVYDGDDPEEYFRQVLPKAVRTAVSQGGEDVRQFLSVWRLRKELGAIGRWIGGVARRVLLEEIELTAELRKEVDGKHHRYDELLKTIDTTFPYLTDFNLPQPPLCLFTGRQLGMWISGGINDFAYVMRYPNGRVMSLDLAHLVQHKSDIKESS